LQIHALQAARRLYRRSLAIRRRMLMVGKIDDYLLRAVLGIGRITRWGFLPERSRPQFQHSEN
jgi:hypothetical protein